MQSQFEEAQRFVTRNRDRISTEDLLSLYGFYKQAKVGICNIAKPSFFEFEAKAKWEAWSKLGNEISSETAMQLYIELAKRFGLGLAEAECPSSLPKQNNLKTSLREVSSLPKNEYIPENDKNAFDLAREGNLDKLHSISHDLSELKDENGMTLMHWACDRGHADLVSYLLTFTKIDEQDFEGNTALHLAYWADHKECIDILLHNHANPHIPNLDGETFANLTSTAL